MSQGPLLSEQQGQGFCPWVCVETVEERAGFLETWGMGDLRRVQPSLGPALLNFSCLPCSDSGSQPGGVPSAPTGPLGPPGHGQTLGKNEAIGAG